MFFYSIIKLPYEVTELQKIIYINIKETRAGKLLSTAYALFYFHKFHTLRWEANEVAKWCP